MQDYRELRVWQEARRVTLAVYRITKSWPKEEIYGLTSQARRAAVSVEANLAEGCARTGSGEWSHFVSMAAGSAALLECELSLAAELGYTPQDAQVTLAEHLAGVRRMLSALARSLQRPTSNVQRPGA